MPSHIATSPAKILFAFTITSLLLFGCSQSLEATPPPAAITTETPIATNTPDTIRYSGEGNLIFLSIEENGYAHLFVQSNRPQDLPLTRITNGEWPLVRGHILTPTDLIVRQHILNIMCRMHTDWRAEQMQLPELPLIIERLKSMQEDGLLEIHDDGLTVLEVGRPFIRNIAMAFDLRLWEKQPETRLFSMTI